MSDKAKDLTDSNKQPTPVKNDGPALWPLVIKDVKTFFSRSESGLVTDDMMERHQYGVRKYGTPLQAGNGRDALVDAYQESLDLVVYLKQESVEKSDDEVQQLYVKALMLAWDLRERIHARDGK